MAAAPQGQSSNIDDLPPALRPRPEAAEPRTRQHPCSGFFVSREGHILTNADVVAGCDSAVAFTVEDETASAPFPRSILARNAGDDLALLTADAVHVTAVDRAPRRAPGRERGGLRLLARGPAVARRQLYNRTVTATRGLGDDDRLLQVSVRLQTGNSGGLSRDGI